MAERNKEQKSATDIKEKKEMQKEQKGNKEKGEDEETKGVGQKVKEKTKKK
jgi:hypothetical protein